MAEQGHPSTTFEDALAGLDAVVARLESGDAGLEEAVSLFEEGQRLLAVCRERLAVAQGRIDELTASELPAIPAVDPFGDDGSEAR